MQQVRRLAFSRFPPPVVTRGSHGTGVTRQFLHSTNIRPSVQQITNERAAKVMGRE